MSTSRDKANVLPVKETDMLSEASVSKHQSTPRSAVEE
jgi:hypothetical protein